ncbi:cytochrome c biogenesis protein DipZ [Candidatus Gottesmanbacteria bacterium]|nr:cytochrome c biogenesis protein DipZ [Candidatus Gottesmanbacteria bacterium]
MIILILFAFLGGLITILSPCILPILPIVLSGSVTGGKRRPMGVVTGFIVSFTFFTLFLSVIVRATGLSADVLRVTAVVVIALSGISLLVPSFQIAVEKLLSRLAAFAPKQNTNDGFLSGVLVGMSLGLIWTPCVGPILASIITLAATSSVGVNAVIITLSYALGTAVPLLAITMGGRSLLTSHPWLLANTPRIQKAFGVLMLITAVAIYNSWDRSFQTYILDKFPAYGTGLTKLEDNAIVRNQLNSLQKGGSMLSNLLESNYGNAPEFIPGGEWINSPPLTMKELRGKVVLIDFWTYTCINCIRTLPYLKAWHEKYNDKGLVIVGVHTPEFEFEKEINNVKKAVTDFGLTYPIMQDNDYKTWRAYANRYWPAKYMVDKNGKIRYTHFGEGDYDETETTIQKLLGETGAEINDKVQNPTYQVESRTPETYLGFERMAGLVSPERVSPNNVVTFTAPVSLPKNSFALSGAWTIGAERATPQTGATLTYRFDAKEVFLVMRPSPNAKGGLRVYLDGKVVTDENKGEDVTEGNVKITSDRLYKLIKLPKAGSHILKLEILDGDIELFAFTFG